MKYYTNVDPTTGIVLSICKVDRDSGMVTEGLLEISREVHEDMRKSSEQYRYDKESGKLIKDLNLPTREEKMLAGMKTPEEVKEEQVGKLLELLNDPEVGKSIKDIIDKQSVKQ